MRERIKQLANGIALCVAFIPWLLYRLEAWLIGDSKAFPGWSQLFSLLPGLSGGYLRRAFYRLTFVECASDCWIEFWNRVFTFHRPHWQESIHWVVLLYRRCDD